MKKIYSLVTLIMLIITNVIYGQGSTDMPDVVGPSPTVSSLMKYEEVPISTYTGLPDVSVPLVSVKLPNKQLSINFGLSYHPLNTKLNDVASDIGLGWSLSGGGSISRTIRGLPDEKFQGGTKYGIFRDNDQRNLNYFDIFQDIQNGENFNVNSAVNILNISTPSNIKEYLWESLVKGKYDNQHDLWQYNFLGHSGRFIIIKNNLNQLEVKPIDGSKLKIENHYLDDSNPNLQYTPIGFTITDESGYKYEFDVIEKTTSNSLSVSIAFNGAENTNMDNYTFNSAFHLSKIYDINDVLLVQYEYLLNAGTEHITSSSTETAHCTSTTDIVNTVNHYVDLFQPLLDSAFIHTLFNPQSRTSTNSSVYEVKKIQKIKILGNGSIEFDYQTGRDDENYTNRTNVKILKSIKLVNSNGQLIKKYELVHTYKNALTLKLFLEKIKLYDKYDEEYIDYYKFEYKEPFGNLYEFNADYWGYLTSSRADLIGYQREANPSLTDSFVLQKVVLPTGGSIVYDYECGTYSNIVTDELDNFDDNPYNWTQNHVFTNFQTLHTTDTLVTLNQNAKRVTYKVQLNTPINDWWFKVYKDSPAQANLVAVITNESTPNFSGFYDGQDLEAGNYIVEFTSTSIGQSNQQSATFDMFYDTKVETNYKNYLYGGGFRIAKISTFESDVNLANNTLTPLTTKEYHYHDFDSISKSSGVLNSKKPIFLHSTSKFIPEMRIDSQNGNDGSFNTMIEQNISYDIHTNYDKINKVLTKGAEIGYKNIKIVESGNGYKKDYYTTSLDFPDEEYSLFKLYLPKRNYDYKRGLLIKQEVYDENARMLINTENNYDFSEELELNGLHVFSTYDDGNNICPSHTFYSSYLNFLIAKSNGCVTSSNPCTMDFPESIFDESLHVGFSVLVEVNGWAKLMSTIKREFFYENNTSNTLETVQNYTYNEFNRNISSQFFMNSLNESLQTNYFYSNDLANSALTQKNMINIPLKTETLKNNELLSTNETTYKDWGNGLLAPELVKVSKGEGDLEIRLRYNHVHPETGVPLELQQENGTLISYIWGYNHTQPVAKIENMAFNSIPSNIRIAVETADTESGLVAALTELRTAIANLDVFLTTYTYIPLVGIKTITDPKGYTMTYHYDNFNRLEKVTDMQGNILSENEYHYRTQN